MKELFMRETIADEEKHHPSIAVILSGAQNARFHYFSNVPKKLCDLFAYLTSTTTTCTWSFALSFLVGVLSFLEINHAAFLRTTIILLKTSN